MGQLPEMIDCKSIAWVCFECASSNARQFRECVTDSQDINESRRIERLHAFFFADTRTKIYLGASLSRAFIRSVESAADDAVW